MLSFFFSFFFKGGIQPLKKPKCNIVHSFEIVLVAMLLAQLFYRET